MALSSQTTYLNHGLTVQRLWSQWRELYFATLRIAELVQSCASEDAWKNMATAEQLPDGSLGGPDSNPDPDNPITVGRPDNQTPLMMSANDLINAKNDLILLAGVFDGSQSAPDPVDHRDDAPSVTNLGG